MELIHGKRTQLEKQLEQREALIEALVSVTRWLNRKLEAGESLTDTVADHQRICTATLLLDAEQERLKASWLELYKREQMNINELEENRQELIQVKDDSFRYLSVLSSVGNYIATRSFSH
jgi:hypothetical protein